MYNKLRMIWLAVGLISLGSLGFHWFGFGSGRLEQTLLVLNVFSLILSLPCSLFVVPVLAAANNFLEINPLSGEGIYLNTIILFAVGAMQWFWIVKFWSPAEPPLQMIGISGPKTD